MTLRAAQAQVAVCPQLRLSVVKNAPRGEGLPGRPPVHPAHGAAAPAPAPASRGWIWVFPTPAESLINFLRIRHPALRTVSVSPSATSNLCLEVGCDSVIFPFVLGSWVVFSSFSQAQGVPDTMNFIFPGAGCLCILTNICVLCSGCR